MRSNKNHSKVFKVRVKNSASDEVSLTLIEKDYQSVWLKLDLLNLSIIEINEEVSHDNCKRSN